MQLTKAKRK